MPFLFWLPYIFLSAMLMDALEPRAEWLESDRRGPLPAEN